MKGELSQGKSYEEIKILVEINTRTIIKVSLIITMIFTSFLIFNRIKETYTFKKIILI
jgi:hypothetical protein